MTNETQSNINIENIPAKENEKIIDLGNPEYYFNRELSLIEFQRRVLAEAQSPEHPLLERLKFISIFSSNLDEFFMIRIAGLKKQIAAGYETRSQNGMTPRETLRECQKRLIPLYELQEKIFQQEIVPALAKEGIIMHERNELSDEERAFLRDYFKKSVLAMLTPLIIDSAHPFPRIINRSLNIAFVLSNPEKPEDEKRYAFLQIPVSIPRLINLHRDNAFHFTTIEQVIKLNADLLFPNLNIETMNTFRVTRDADIEIVEDEADDLMEEIAEQIKTRLWGTAAVKLEVSPKMPTFLVEFLKETLNLESEDVYVHSRPLSLADLSKITKLDLDHLKDKPFVSRTLPALAKPNTNIFDVLRKKDLLVHHPFDSFSNSVLKLLNAAVKDDKVRAIKIALYRVGNDSPVVDALMRAAEKGKEVTVFVEIKARFDEENNIQWARELEKMGLHVIYGVLGLKTHCKIAMIVREENGVLKNYLHLGTGNYNHITSRLYTDLGLLTSNKAMGADAVNFFNRLTGFSNFKNWNKLIVAPNHLHNKVIELIERETELHTEENPGLIIAKMNSLTHKGVIKALYKAAIKGVKIQLLIRGICCLRPNVEGISENIEVRSVVGRFLEHTRIIYFKNAGEEEIFLTSADWMTRNLHNRVELMFPVESEDLKKELKEILDVYWRDNSKAWRLGYSGDYEKLTPSGEEGAFSAQQYLLDRAAKKAKKQRKKINRI